MSHKLFKADEVYITHNNSRVITFFYSSFPKNIVEQRKKQKETKQKLERKKKKKEKQNKHMSSSIFA